MNTRLLAMSLVLALSLPFVACTNMNKTQQGALSGAALGAGAGAGISALAGGHAGVGAALGGVLGGAVGGIYGHNQSDGRHGKKGKR